MPLAIRLQKKNVNVYASDESEKHGVFYPYSLIELTLQIRFLTVYCREERLTLIFKFVWSTSTFLFNYRAILW